MIRHVEDGGLDIRRIKNGWDLGSKRK
jgi:hypothetical protein